MAPFLHAWKRGTSDLFAGTCAYVGVYVALMFIVNSKMFEKYKWKKNKRKKIATATELEISESRVKPLLWRFSGWADAVHKHIHACGVRTTHSIGTQRVHKVE